MCTEERNSTKFKCPFWQKEVFSQLYWKILDSLSKFYTWLLVQWRELLPCTTGCKRYRAEHCAELTAVLRGRNNTRKPEDLKESNWTMVTLFFCDTSPRRSYDSALSVSEQKKPNKPSGYWMIPVTKLRRISAPGCLSFTSDLALTHMMYWNNCIFPHYW